MAAHTCRIPSSTYRLQLNAHFTVGDTLRLIPYFRDLGVGALYVSPILKARSGSNHGYDAVDHDHLNPEIGSHEDFRRLGEELGKAGMGLIVDIVPNHMCIADEGNWRWHDVLENGPSSPQAQFFDVDWNPPRESLEYKVLIPVLGEQYGRVMESGELQLKYGSGTFSLSYWDKVFPVAPRTWRMILEPVAATLASAHGEDEPHVNELRSVITALTYLPKRNETDPHRIRERQREKEIIKSRIHRLASDWPEFCAALEQRLAVMNGTPGNPSSFDELEELLSDQAYRLSYWRVAADEINYRRFFDINELAAIRVEDPIVFDAVHATILDGIREGWITGLRVDHPDGLYDPSRYFARLQSAAAEALGVSTEGKAVARPFYVVAEKIMGSEERPRRDWAVHGTTGYGFLNEVNALFVEPDVEGTIHDIYSAFTSTNVRFADLVYECKRLILRVSLSSELNVLSRKLDRICHQHRLTRDFTLESLRFALREVISCFPVYRTYISEDSRRVDPEDRRQIHLAIDEAKQRNPATSETIFDVIASILLLHDPPNLSAEQVSERRLFVMRFQQLTGPVMAKSVEDTAFYREYPLASLNEVGGDPLTFGLTPETFHLRIKSRAEHWPSNLLATSTHDTKRGEDVRARINVISEIPAEWSAALQRWREMNRQFKPEVDGGPAPPESTEYLLYQTLIGAWPNSGLTTADEHQHFVQRIQAYMEKASREAKLHTSWINPDVEYDAALQKFIGDIMDRSRDNPFLADLERFIGGVSRAGFLNSLSQTVLKLTCPGVPDIYQGNELFELVLVDPDNRQPVDYEKRRQMLSALPLGCRDRRDWIRHASDTLADGRLKLFLTVRLACLRREHPQFFEQSNYVGITPVGKQDHHVVAFARAYGGSTLIVAVGRFFRRLDDMTANSNEPAWEELRLRLPASLGGRKLNDIFSGEEVQVDQNGMLPLTSIFARLPVAVFFLTSEGDYGKAKN